MVEQKQFRASATWVEGLQFVARGELSGATMVFDGAPDHGGNGAGARPMEGLLMSLAGCTGMDVMSILQKKRQRVTGFSMNVRGTAAPDFPKCYTAIEIEYVVRGIDIAPEAVARAIELSQTRYCAVTASLAAPVSFSYRIEPEPLVS